MDEQKLMETVLSKQVVYPGAVIRLEHWQVRLPDGATALREVACHPGAAAVVALDGEGRVVLVRQYRAAVGRLTTEIPAGKLNGPDEDPLDCAKRELSEETGYSADAWRFLTVLETTPGFCNERIHLFLATGLHPQAAHPDADEFVAVTGMTLAEAVSRVLSGEIRDGKTVAGLLMAARLQNPSAKVDE